MRLTVRTLYYDAECASMLFLRRQTTRRIAAPNGEGDGAREVRQYFADNSAVFRRESYKSMLTQN